MFLFTKIFIKKILLHIFKFIGLFKIARYLKRKELIILAYHGVEIEDESRFSSSLYVKLSTLEKRILYLRKENFSIISLDDALCQLKAGTLRTNSVVITFDDGWYSTIFAHKLFIKHKCPYTIYVSSYYAIKEIPVLNVLLRYMIWFSKEHYDYINLDALNLPNIKGDIAIKHNTENLNLTNILYENLESLENTNQKIDFIKELSKILGFDYDIVANSRRFNNLTSKEISALSVQNVNIQLHTHRHRMPLHDENIMMEEITENIFHLSPVASKKLNHFCYPSGHFDPNCESVLKQLGLETAVTCERGFVTKKTNWYFLPRFLDGENVSQIEFEAEVSGIIDILLKAKDWLCVGKSSG